jgi:hypothetical protein
MLGFWDATERADKTLELTRFRAHLMVRLDVQSDLFRLKLVNLTICATSCAGW